MRTIFTNFEAKLTGLEQSLADCQGVLSLESFKNQSLNPAIRYYNDQIRLLKKTNEEQEKFNQITAKLDLLRTRYQEKKKSLALNSSPIYMVGKNFILGPEGFVKELPQAKSNQNPLLTEEGTQVIEEKHKVFYALDLSLNSQASNPAIKKPELLRTPYPEKKKSLTKNDDGVYLIGKNFILGPEGLVDELPKANIDKNPPLPQKAMQAIEEKNKVLLLQFLYQYCEEKFAAKEPPGFVSLKMIDALWDMGTRGHELADLLKKALPDYDKSGNQLSQARHIALKNTTALIYQRLWNSGDSSIECYALNGFERQYISGFNEKGFSFTKPNPLLSTKNIPSKMSENGSMLFNRRGHLRKIISDAILNPKAEDSRMTPTVYVTNDKVWTDESSQSQESRCFGGQGRFWKRWQKKKEQDEVIAETENGDVPSARMLTERHGPGW